MERDNLFKIPLVTIEEEEPILESDAYLESLLAEDLTDDNDVEDVVGLADIA